MMTVAMLRAFQKRFQEITNIPLELAEPNWSAVRSFPLAFVDLTNDSYEKALAQAGVRRATLSIFVVDRVLEQAKDVAVLGLVAKKDALEQFFRIGERIYVDNVMFQVREFSFSSRTLNEENNFVIVGIAMRLEINYYVEVN